MFIGGIIEKFVYDNSESLHSVLKNIESISEKYGYTALANLDNGILLKAGPYYIAKSPLTAITAVKTYQENEESSSDYYNSLEITSIFYDAQNLFFYHELSNYLLCERNIKQHISLRKTISDDVNLIVEGLNVDFSLIENITRIFEANKDSNVSLETINHTLTGHNNLSITIIPTEYKEKVINKISNFLGSIFKYDDTSYDKDNEYSIGIDEDIVEDLCKLFQDNNQSNYLYGISSSLISFYSA